MKWRARGYANLGESSLSSQHKCSQARSNTAVAGSSDEAGPPLAHIAAVLLLALVALAITVACCTGVLHVGNSDKGFWDRGMQEYMELEVRHSLAPPAWSP